MAWGNKNGGKRVANEKLIDLLVLKLVRISVIRTKNLVL